MVLVTQSLWLTPDLLSAMRPMRKWGYILGCVAVATGLWSDATLNLAPEVMAIGALRTGEIGQLSGLWRPKQGGTALFVISQLVCGLLLVLAAAFLCFDLAIARTASRALKIAPPRKVSFRYFLLLISGDVATLFALFWLIWRVVSPPGQAVLRWLDRHPLVGAPLFAIVCVASISGFMLWQMALHERGRQALVPSSPRLQYRQRGDLDVGVCRVGRADDHQTLDLILG